MWEDAVQRIDTRQGKEGKTPMMGQEEERETILLRRSECFGVEEPFSLLF